ncbi:MAG: hypothetical protein GY820_10345, partial [Gammaproteobacteria bacterium]|nr:hypothetical protein [Gammaproteobacteria bacterium]
MAKKSELNQVVETWIPNPEEEALPIQCVDVATMKIDIEGVTFRVIPDTGAGPSLIVPRTQAIIILAKKCDGRIADINKHLRPPSGDVRISNCTGGEVPIMGQAVVTMQFEGIRVRTPMLVMNADSDKADCLLGSYGMKQLGFTLRTARQRDLLGQDLPNNGEDLWPKMSAPVVLPKMVHMQVSLLRCYSTKGLNLGPLHKGKVQMKAPDCKSKGAYLFTPSEEGMAAGLRQESIQMGRKGNFTLPVRNDSAQMPIQVHKHVTV